MFKVVLIDDEALVKIGLRSMLDWNEEGFDIVGEASSGREGLALIMKTRPDLVITDIVMPEMDGIEMIQKVKENNLNPIFVVLSSYDQFELVKKAMQLGARDYLLKLKVNHEALHEMVETIKLELKKKGVQTTEKKERTTWEKEELRRAFFEKSVIGEAVCLESGGLEVRLDEDHIRVAYLVSNVSHVMESKDDAERKIYLATIGKLIEDISREFFESYCIEWDKGRFLIFLSDQGEEDTNCDLKLMAEAIIDMLKQYSNIQASIGISGNVQGYGKLKDAYLQAKMIQDFLPMEGYGKVILFDSMPVSDTSSRNGISNELFDIERIASICESMDRQELERSSNKIITEVLNHCIELDNASFHCTRFMCLAEEYLKRNWGDSYTGSKLNSYMKKIYHSDTVGEIAEVFSDYIKDVQRFFSERSNNESERIVREAKKYIREHVYDNIGLKEIAEALFISAGYLSATFSKCEPMGIANYINKIKIAEAQRLLVQQRLKVYEVSFQLGYENAGYFAKVFKKYAGCTPKEYAERK